MNTMYSYTNCNHINKNIMIEIRKKYVITVQKILILDNVKHKLVCNYMHMYAHDMKYMKSVMVCFYFIISYSIIFGYFKKHICTVLFSSSTHTPHFLCKTSLYEN